MVVKFELEMVLLLENLIMIIILIIIAFECSSVKWYNPFVQNQICPHVVTKPFVLFDGQGVLKCRDSLNMCSATTVLVENCILLVVHWYRF